MGSSRLNLFPYLIVSSSNFFRRGIYTLPAIMCCNSIQAPEPMTTFQSRARNSPPERGRQPLEPEHFISIFFKIAGIFDEGKEGSVTKPARNHCTDTVISEPETGADW